MYNWDRKCVLHNLGNWGHEQLVCSVDSSTTWKIKKIKTIETSFA